MLEPSHNDELPEIPGKRYFTIGEVSELCAVKPPVKRRGNRRYYQRQDVLTIRQIRALLYDQGFTIGGARLQMTDEGGKADEQPTNELVQDIIKELEEVLAVLKT